MYCQHKTLNEEKNVFTTRIPQEPNNIGNQHADRVIVAPISSSRTGKVYPFEVLLKAGEVSTRPSEGGLSQRSKVLLDQIRAVDKSRLGNRIGRLKSKQMKEVNRAIRLSLAV